MNKPVDQITMSVPLLMAMAAIYFVFIWKPRQTNARTVARVSGVFWSTVLLMVVVVLVYANFFRG